MTATVTVNELNGNAPGSKTSLATTVGRYCTADMSTPGLQYPCVVPGGTVGTLNRSYWKSHVLSVSTSTSWNTISSIQWFCGGNISGSGGSWHLGTSGGLYVGTMNETPGALSPDSGSTTYTKADGSQGTSGTAIEDGSHGYPPYGGTGAQGHVTMADGFIQTQPLMIDAGPHQWASGAFDSKILVTQVRIDADAQQGQKDALTFTFRYNEV